MRRSCPVLLRQVFVLFLCFVVGLSGIPIAGWRPVSGLHAGGLADSDDAHAHDLLPEHFMVTPWEDLSLPAGFLDGDEPLASALIDGVCILPQVYELLQLDTQDYGQYHTYYLDSLLENISQGRLTFSTMAEREHALLMVYLGISDVDITYRLLRTMESDGFTLYDSLYLMRIVSSGLFSYQEAVDIFYQGRFDAFLEFKRFVRIFDIAGYVNDNSLLYAPFVPINAFPNDELYYVVLVDEHGYWNGYWNDYVVETTSPGAITVVVEGFDVFEDYLEYEFSVDMYERFARLEEMHATLDYELNFDRLVSSIRHSRISRTSTRPTTRPPNRRRAHDLLWQELDISALQAYMTDDAERIDIAHRADNTNSTDNTNHTDPTDPTDPTYYTNHTDSTNPPDNTNPSSNGSHLLSSDHYHFIAPLSGHIAFSTSFNPSSYSSVTSCPSAPNSYSLHYYSPPYSPLTYFSPSITSPGGIYVPQPTYPSTPHYPSHPSTPSTPPPTYPSPPPSPPTITTGGAIDIQPLCIREHIQTQFIISTGQAAFDEARLLFLQGYSIDDISLAITLSAALQTNPRDSIAALNALDMCELAISQISAFGTAIMTLSVVPIDPLAEPSAPTHSDILGSAFNLRFNANDSVSLNTGSAMFRENIVSLPGRGGFGFSLDLVYNSSRADITTPRIVVCPILEGNYCSHAGWNWWNQCSTRQETEPSSNNGLGIGWFFDIPYINNGTVHIPGRGSFSRDQHSSWFLPPGISIRDSGHGVNRVTYLEFYNGTVYQFNSVGRINFMSDRFGNTIRFEHRATIASNNPYVSSTMALSRIIDSNGKVISIDYRSVGIAGRVATVTDPGGSVFTINMSRISGHTGYQLDSIVNQVGSTTRFLYTIRNSTFNMHSTSLRPIDVYWAPLQSLLLTRVTYPSGGQLRFEYIQRHSYLSRTSARQVWQVSTRELFANGRSYLRTRFIYSGIASLYRVSPIDYEYSVIVSQNNGRLTEYVFNQFHLSTRQLTTDSTAQNIVSTSMTYDLRRLPATINTIELANGRSRSTTQRFEHNVRGQLTMSTSPLAMGSTHERYRTVITYDARFGIPTSTVFWVDANTRVEESNILSADGRSITLTFIAVNGVRQSTTQFRHDAFGNVIEVQEMGGANTGTTQITFDRGTLPSSIRTLNVRDANDMLVGGTGIVERRFSYDNMWRLVSETDAMGYTTRWQYDNIGRVTRIDLADGGVISYMYFDTISTILHTTVLGELYTYRFCPLGNLESIRDLRNNVIRRNVYDDRMRLVSTFNAPGLSSSREVRFRYDEFDRVISEAVLSQSANSGYYSLTTTQYIDISDASLNRRIVTTAVGQSGNPDIVTFVQYDRFGRRNQQGTVGGMITTFTHDLAGRVIRETSLGVDNRFVHNIFGVVSVTNINGHTARNRYDSSGRLTHSSDFMGNYQRFVYSKLTLPSLNASLKNA